MVNPVNTSRRALLRGRLAPPEPVARPPWAVEETAFVEGCTRCDACLPACSEGIIVKGAGGFPEIDFTRSGCTFCRDCVDACPEPVFLDPDSAPPWSYRADIQPHCLAHQGVFCQSCRDVCEVRAIRFGREAGRIPVPRLDAETCTGCGFCVSVCPARAIALKSETVFPEGFTS